VECGVALFLLSLCVCVSQASNKTISIASISKNTKQTNDIFFFLGFVFLLVFFPFYFLLPFIKNNGSSCATRRQKKRKGEATDRQTKIVEPRKATKEKQIEKGVRR